MKTRFSLNVDKILLLLLILSCQIKGIISEEIFFICIFVLIFQKNSIKNLLQNYRSFIFIIFIYCFLLMNLLLNFYPDITWRLVGITKCFCGISVMVLISDKLCKRDIFKDFFYILIIINILASFSNITGFLGNGFFDLIGGNTALGINMVFWPHIIYHPLRKFGVSGVFYWVSMIMLGCSYVSGALLIGVFLLVIVTMICYLGNTRIKININSKRVIIDLLLGCGMILLLLFVFDIRIRQIYFDMIAKFDKARTDIMTYGFSRRETLPFFELMWGSGDNRYAVAYGRIMEAHNFIIETLTMFGFAGIIVLIYETIIFWKLILHLDISKKYLRPIIFSVLYGYMIFLIHPTYSTSFVFKIFLVLVNMNEYYCVRRSANLKKFQLGEDRIYDKEAKK